MSRAIGETRDGGSVRTGIVLALLAFGTLPALGQSLDRAIAPSDRISSGDKDLTRTLNAPRPLHLPILPASASREDVAEPAPARVNDASPTLMPSAVARYEGTGATGLTVTLVGNESTGSDLHYRWEQTEGPPVKLDEPTGPMAQFTVPEGSGRLGFLLIVGNGAGVDSATVQIPILGRAAASAAGLQADAGDDQIGIVGRQVTLNGVRSEPRGTIGYRWIQTGGPDVRLKIEDGYIYTFVPHEPGLYRFVLVVASGGAISEPDTVDVWVQATPPNPPAAAAPASAPAMATAAVPTQPPSVPLDLFVRASLLSIPGAAASAEDLGIIFETIALRMELYGSYAEVFQEMSRRLEGVVPGDPAQRKIWVDHLFTPLTRRLIEAMIAEGLDLRLPAAQNAPMSGPQKVRMAELFQEMARGFQAARDAQ